MAFVFSFVYHSEKMRILFHIIKYVLLIILFVILFSVLYFSIHGLPDAITENILKRVQISGIVLTLDKIKLDVFEGFVATGVRCYRTKEIGRPLFEAEKVIFRLCPERWLKKENGVVKVIVKNGAICFLIPGPGESASRQTAQCSNMLIFENIYAVLNLEKKGFIQVVELTMDFFGINVTGHGTWALPADRGTEVDVADRPGTGDVLGQVGVQKSIRKCLHWFNSIQLNKGVNVDVSFFIDPMEIRNLDIQMRIKAKNLRIKQSCVGIWNTGIEINGKTGRGTIDIKNCLIEGAWVEKAFCRFKFNDETLSIEQFDGIIGRDSLQGPLNFSADYHWRTREYEGHLSCGFNPHVFLVPLKKHHLQNVSRSLARFEFASGPPDCTGDFKGTINDHPRFQIEGQAQVEHCFYRGVSNVLIKTDISFDFSETNASMKLAPCRVVRDEGVVQGWMSMNFLSKTVDFDVQSTADPRAVAQIIGPFMKRVTDRFRFGGPVSITASGTAGYIDEKKNDIDVDIQAEQLGWKKFVSDQCSLNVLAKGDNIAITNIHGTVYGGTIDGSVSIYPLQGKTNRQYKVQAKADDVDFGLLICAIKGQSSDVYKGRLSADVCLQGEVGDNSRKSVKGEGNIKIGDSRFFRFPLFNGLSDVLITFVPGMSLVMRRTDAKASLVIRDEKIYSDDIIIEGDLMSLKGKGDYSFDGDLNFDVQFVLLRRYSIIGVVIEFVTFPVSKTFEFRLSGSLESPHWAPIYLPKEMFLIFD